MKWVCFKRFRKILCCVPARFARDVCSVFRFEVSTQHVTRYIFQGFKVNETHPNEIAVHRILKMQCTAVFFMYVVPREYRGGFGEGRESS